MLRSDAATVHRRAYGRALRHYRHRAGLTLADLASRLGVSRPQLGRLELGDRPLSVCMLERVASLLGIQAATIARRARREARTITRRAARRAGRTRADRS